MMYIKKLSVSSFGKLKAKNFELTDGLNVVYGDNESGKTTLLAFIRFMLFGFRGRRGTSVMTAEEKYTPWDNTAASGSMDYEYDGCEYITSRSVGVRRECSTLNNTLGTRSFEGSEPGEEIFNLNESAFLRTYCLSAVSASFLPEKNDDILKRLSNLASNGDETISYERISADISADKKRLCAELKAKNDEMLSLRRRLEKIGALRERRKVLSAELCDADSEIYKMRERVDNTDRQNERFDRMSERLFSCRIKRFFEIIILVLLAIFTGVAAASGVFGIKMCLIPAGMALIDIFLIAAQSAAISRLKEKIASAEQDAHIYSEDIRSGINKAESRKNGILKEMGAVESQIDGDYSYDDICSHIDMLSDEKNEISAKLDVIEKARYIIDKSYEELKSIFVPELNRRASEIFSALTGYKYNDIIITDEFEIKVKSDYDFKPSQSFSGGMVELMYFSLRLALCDFLGGEEKLPVFLDDCFAFLDDKKAKTALEFLKGYSSRCGQIVFCTCHAREFNILSELGDVNVIRL